MMMMIMIYLNHCAKYWCRERKCLKNVTFTLMVHIWVLYSHQFFLYLTVFSATMVHSILLIQKLVSLRWVLLVILTKSIVRYTLAISFLRSGLQFSIRYWTWLMQASVETNAKEKKTILKKSIGVPGNVSCFLDTVKEE